MQLALDGNLILSVNLVNNAMARIGKLVPKSEAGTYKINGEFAKALIEDFGPDVTLEHYNGIDYSSEYQLILEEKIYGISNIWDLPMVGSEVLDISHLYQMETDGPSIELVNLDGTFLIKNTDKGQIIAQLQERFDKDTLEKLERENLPYNSERNYFPAGELPNDCNIIIKTENLTSLINSLSSSSENPSPKTKNSYLSTIRHLSDALVDGLTGKPNKDASSVIQALSFKGIELDIGEKTLANYLKSAQENL
ncbi:hypothetical protein QNI23_014840 [Bermanella sp. WJH001]|uniref:hypothetical protein n=1 Tax=Bermanella sp. WJH001 TaxID=3048005 RepID=UPI0024BDA51A|nr:hypothetical protein [Bermanella sp. WJH001]MDJ1539287.1 hypothetical protein [Bermanella sp. WJH001]